MAGLATGVPHNLRLDQPQDDAVNDDEPVQIHVVEGGDDVEERDEKGNLLRIEHPDGTITISTDGGPLDEGLEPEDPPGWYDNLVGKVNEMELGILADDILRGIQDDLATRQSWIDQRTEGLKLLGLRLETGESSGDSADGAAVEGMSRVRHPVMLEAVLNFQANFRGEMLPVDGPCKIRSDDNNATPDQDELGDDLERDMNHFLTVVATEFYPDTDRMAFELGFSGLGVKKVYFCPLRNRPVSELVETDDLIVNNSATDLQNAIRITHRIMMRPALFRRMQIKGVYADIDVGHPNPPMLDALKSEKKDQQGIQPTAFRPEDRDRELYECYVEYNIRGFEHEWKGKPSGLPLPWCVTIDVSSRKILAIRRNYAEPQAPDDLPVADIPFVDYQFVPGFGFYPIGLLHVLGQMTNAVTAAWREMLDAGMFACFPGFLYAKEFGSQNTLVARVPPGGGVGVDTRGMPINQAIMALPYNSQGMPSLFQLQESIAQYAQRVGQTSQVQVAEGRADVPVGTTLAMIEQGQKLMSAVHKRNHTSQSRELEKIIECFRRHPESFWTSRGKKDMRRPWDEQTFRRALDNCMLVPQSDPNTASQLQRMMKVAALALLQGAAPALYDPVTVEKMKIRALGYSNPEQIMAPEEAIRQPPPELLQAKAELANETKKADATMLTAQANAQKIQGSAGSDQAKAQAEAQKAQSDQGLGMAKLHLQARDQEFKNKLAAADAMTKHGLAIREQDSTERKDLLAGEIQLVDVAQNLSVHPDSAALVAPLVQPAYHDIQQRKQELQAKKVKGLGMMPPNPVVPSTEEPGGSQV